MAGLNFRGDFGFARLGCLSFLLVTRIPVPFVLVKGVERKKGLEGMLFKSIFIYPYIRPSTFSISLTFISLLLAMVIRPAGLLCDKYHRLRHLLDDWKEQDRNGINLIEENFFAGKYGDETR